MNSGAASWSEQSRSRSNHASPMRVNYEYEPRLINSRLYGVFFEDVNRAGPGGLDAQLLFNADFEAQGRNNKWPTVPERKIV